MKLLLITIFTSLLFLTGCTENERAKHFGGTATVEKPNADWQLVTITWKETEIWTLWYEPETDTCYFQEKAQFGLVEGTIVIKDCNPISRRIR